ncbi:MAG: diaminopimelate decarboxylase, partial [Chloroflexi bacterium]|nr:diaminopimelate decarboxylase [Chloroflexota bacterium]
MGFPNQMLFPMTAGTESNGHLSIGGCDVADLADEFGTPLYIYDEVTIRTMCREFVKGFTKHYPNTKVLYASKAFINPAIARIIAEEGLGIDVVSGGELAVAIAVDFDPEGIFFHGNNKTPQELDEAVEQGIGRIVVDSFHELELLNDIARRRNVTQNIMLRVSPSVDPHTHHHTTTGILDSKFGFSIQTGHAAQAVEQALAASNLKLTGIHFHLGSPIFELEPYAIAIDTVLNFLAPFKAKGLELKDFSPGGGFAIGYVRDTLPPDISAYAEVIAKATTEYCKAYGFDLPRLIIEPGRAIIGRAGVALYRVGAIKDIPSVRKYVSLDGGMGDNIRPALYDSKYEAVVANKVNDKSSEKVTLAGKYCESGDILIRDVTLPDIESGDLI